MKIIKNKKGKGNKGRYVFLKNPVFCVSHVFLQNVYLTILPNRVRAMNSATSVLRL